MDTFKTLLFGISGLSMIFWICLIAMWHVDVFPRIFAHDSWKDINSNSYSRPQARIESSILQGGSLQPSWGTESLSDRGKYTRKSFVIADFGLIENTYSINRLYTATILSLGAMSFIALVYGLHSALNLPL